MNNLFLTYFSIILYYYVIFCDSSNIFHDGSQIVFKPNMCCADFFGYSVLLMKNQLMVGAPKASQYDFNTHTINDTIKPGLVFSCQFEDFKTKIVNCSPSNMPDTEVFEEKPGQKRNRRIRSNINTSYKHFFRDDMWFGANIATVSNFNWVTAPRYTKSVRYTESEISGSYEDFCMNGACYTLSGNQPTPIQPLDDIDHQSYGEDKNNRINHYRYGQVGMSLKATDYSVILGAPGMMNWKGGLIELKLQKDDDGSMIYKETAVNIINTTNILQNDYFGYSVESGVFEKNGNTLYVVGAPRCKNKGKVFFIEPSELRKPNPTLIKYSLEVESGQMGNHIMGSYYGASLCSMDVNKDGKLDILIGAPNYYENGYDQGGVYVYLNNKHSKNLKFHRPSILTGSTASGARFGNTIAELGDIDGDGFSDVAIGAPWEDLGHGAVYIYKGGKKGFENQYAQRIVSEDARGFGISIAKGLDIDRNYCNDIAIGAYKSRSAYIYRCVPTVTVIPSIEVPNQYNLPQNSKNFSAIFCVSATTIKAWENITINFNAIIQVDSERGRVSLTEKGDYLIAVKSTEKNCKEYNIIIKPAQDFSEPIEIKFELKEVDSLTNSSLFNENIGRLPNETELSESLNIQLTKGCGDDKVCTPQLILAIESTGGSTYTQGLDTKLGAKIRLINKKEPAYSYEVNITLPYNIKNIPENCEHNKLNLICSIPSPLGTDESKEWEIDLEYVADAEDMVGRNVTIMAEIIEHNKEIDDHDTRKIVNILVKSQASFSVKSDTLTRYNKILIPRTKYERGELIKLEHKYLIQNNGPSDWINLKATVELPEMVDIQDDLNNCTKVPNSNNYTCSWSISANAIVVMNLPMSLNLNKNKKYLEDNLILNITSKITLMDTVQSSLNQTSTLLLVKKPPLWPWFVGIAIGLIVVFLITFVLYKKGFFARNKREEMKNIIKEEKRRSAMSTGSNVRNSVNVMSYTQEVKEE